MKFYSNYIALILWKSRNFSKQTRRMVKLTYEMLAKYNSTKYIYFKLVLYDGRFQFSPNYNNYKIEAKLFRKLVTANEEVDCIQ